MVMKKSVITQKELQDLLESDDELPTTYNEIADIPAYQDDNRFNHILARNKEMCQSPKTPRTNKSNNESINIISSSLKDSSNDRNPLLVTNKKITEPQKSSPSKKSNSRQSSDFVCLSDKDNSTTSNHLLVPNKKIVQPPQSRSSEKSDKPIDFIHLSDKDSSIELTFFADEFIKPIGEEQKVRDRLVIKKGILSQQDIVCIKSIEATENNSTLIWFINYLLCKDMQSPYTCLSSCLVGDLDYHANNCDKDDADVDTCDLNIEIVIKCK